MKMNEYREVITNNLRKVRRSGDLEVIKRVIDLIFDLKNNVDLDRNCVKWILLINILRDSTPTDQLDLLHGFMQEMESDAGKRGKTA